MGLQPRQLAAAQQRLAVARRGTRPLPQQQRAQRSRARTSLSRALSSSSTGVPSLCLLGLPAGSVPWGGGSSAVYAVLLTLDCACRTRCLLQAQGGQGRCGQPGGCAALLHAAAPRGGRRKEQAVRAGQETPALSSTPRGGPSWAGSKGSSWRAAESASQGLTKPGGRQGQLSNKNSPPSNLVATHSAPPLPAFPPVSAALLWLCGGSCRGPGRAAGGAGAQKL